jgi:hypothetical protein
MEADDSCHRGAWTARAVMPGVTQVADGRANLRGGVGSEGLLDAFASRHTAPLRGRSAGVRARV